MRMYALLTIKIHRYSGFTQFGRLFDVEARGEVDMADGSVMKGGGAATRGEASRGGLRRIGGNLMGNAETGGLGRRMDDE